MRETSSANGGKMRSSLLAGSILNYKMLSRHSNDEDRPQPVSTSSVILMNSFVSTVILIFNRVTHYFAWPHTIRVLAENYNFNIIIRLPITDKRNERSHTLML